MQKPKIIGLSASLRNARSNIGSKELVREISALGSREELDDYLEREGNTHLDQFVQAGRKDGLPFDTLYRKLRRMGGLRGLSNSEICLAAALWGAHEKGAAIDHIALSDHFPADGTEQNIPELKNRLAEADGVILATPVYFGDRSSLAHRFIEMIRSDDALRANLDGKVYAGVAVGAKRNGGQETALIYQMLDMSNMGLLAVGNDSETTSQYGGTGHAGDIGSMPNDRYGIDTSIGAGRRVARVASIQQAASGFALVDRLRVGLWILQDRDDELSSRLAPFFDNLRKIADVHSADLFRGSIRPCIACDICPTHVGPDEEYRCIIRRRDDTLANVHAKLLDVDMIIPAALSPRNRMGLESVYQQFMERTRYIRRGDYAFTDRLVAPLIFSEIGANENLDIRMMTSFLRHHTIMHRPIIGWIHDGILLNPGEVHDGIHSALKQTEQLVRGRFGFVSRDSRIVHYRPVGYVLAQAKDDDPHTMSEREKATAQRKEKMLSASRTRIEPANSKNSGRA